ncbi:FK506-binding protein [Actinomadura rubteroloni]|uniref:peptidylprolyl isomerase n=1 Tax=Actinomadura rubteroloni TaxID=1926885 RepID=A0A2P4URJ8_9ACTN|nr:FKBP-type peptidyl-prolyl cis-trans isomerase [Actinomadura rubteroloni]POM27669.1 FK506-binding protein [Actinomadura rubteroloni]
MSEDGKPRGEPAVKAKLPNAKSLRSPEFTPHGISAGRKGGGPRPSGLTAAQARKRKRLGILAAVVVVLVVAGGITYLVTRPGPEIKVTGAFGKKPSVKIPAGLEPAKKLSTSTPIKGSGTKAASGSAVYGRYTFYQWTKGTGDDAKKKSTSKEIDSSFSATAQQIRPLVIGKTGVKGVDEGLVGQTAGSRVVLEIPPGKGFGSQGEQMGIAATDSIVFVVDILGVYPKGMGPSGTAQEQKDKNLPSVAAGKPGEAPKVTMPKTDAPSKLQVETIVQGTGKALAKNDNAVVQYQGQLWRDGKVFDSSFTNGVPALFPIGVKATVPGFDKGLTGQKVGSRVLLVLPPSEGYGKNGNPQAGIKGTDTLVFVVDILGTIST